MHKIRTHLYHWGALVALAALLHGCNGGVCAASYSVLEDADADCVKDDSDNCVSHSNPGATYNPEQFDGDEDGLGPPCDGDDTDDTAALIKDVAFNISGLYELSDDCADFQDLSVLQNETTIIAEAAAGRTLDGHAALSPDGTWLQANFADANADCLLGLDVLTGEASLECETAAGSCRATGRRAVVQLWSEILDPKAAIMDADEGTTP